MEGLRGPIPVPPVPLVPPPLEPPLGGEKMGAVSVRKSHRVALGPQ